MNDRVVLLKNWLNKRSKREQLYLFLSGFLFLYLFYFMFFHRPLSLQKNDAMQKIVTLQTQQVSLLQQIDNIKAIIKAPTFLQMLAEQKRLTLQLASMQKQLDKLKSNFFLADELPMITKHILKLHNNVGLISLGQLPAEPWVAQTGINKENLLNSFTGIYQHILQIDFQNDYFSTIDYLDHLEKISNHLYWDSMNYKVLTYPKAEVVIKFHVLSLQKS